MSWNLAANHSFFISTTFCIEHHREGKNWNLTEQGRRNIDWHFIAICYLLGCWCTYVEVKRQLSGISSLLLLLILRFSRENNSSTISSQVLSKLWLNTGQINGLWPAPPWVPRDWLPIMVTFYRVLKTQTPEFIAFLIRPNPGQVHLWCISCLHTSHPHVIKNIRCRQVKQTWLGEWKHVLVTSQEVQPQHCRISCPGASGIYRLPVALTLPSGIQESNSGCQA